MKITALTAQQKDPNRINVIVDGKFRFSLDIYQVADLGIRVGREYSEADFVELETESQFGKLYARALEYCLMRPHSAREVKDYLYKKTLTKRYKSRSTGELKERLGVSSGVAERVYERLVEKGYVDDEKFARFWVENKNQRKGSSMRKLKAELMAKGVRSSVIEKAISETERDNITELRKIVAKKRRRYADDMKFRAYLANQGFSYSEITQVLAEDGVDDDTVGY